MSAAELLAGRPQAIVDALETIKAVLRCGAPSKGFTRNFWYNRTIAVLAHSIDVIVAVVFLAAWIGKKFITPPEELKAYRLNCYPPLDGK